VVAACKDLQFRSHARLALIADDQLVTGIQKREMLLAKQGCEDPWGFSKVIRRGSGRENDPTVVPSAFDARLVGCLCLDDIFKGVYLENCLIIHKKRTIKSKEEILSENQRIYFKKACLKTEES